MLSSSVAYQRTHDAASFSTSQIVSDEISQLELAIQGAASSGRYTVIYNARVIGNPAVDVTNTDGLTAMQNSFLSALLGAGYNVTRDTVSGWWSVSWAQVGPEGLVKVYTFRTTVSPGAVTVQTVSAISNFFALHNPTATARAVQFAPTGSGGNVDETLFGASASLFYEYVTVVNQQDNLDYSSALLTALRAAGLGYTSGNSYVWQMVG